MSRRKKRRVVGKGQEKRCRERQEKEERERKRRRDLELGREEKISLEETREKENRCLVERRKETDEIGRNV